ncbi:OmpH family outer membrane protein [Spongiimicrobium salis]|uniref:OmpH family outer membrane protein n=1 Tax=Spongiimicrobium salis TaxID=1667022 RepID=UPI00374D25AE
MKKLILALVLLVSVACQQDKIAYVDYTKLLNDYQEKIDIEAKFKTKLEAMNKKRDSLGQMIQLEAQTIQTKNASQKTKQEEMNVLQQKSQFLGQQLQQEEQLLQQEGRTETDTLISKVKKEVADYGKANAYTYILGGGEGGTVLYGDDTKDITDAILKILNDKYKKN